MIRDYFLNADVLSVACYSKYILAGIGNDLYIFSYENLISRIKIFSGERIHNIQVFKNDILLKGCKEICVVNLLEEGDELDWEILYSLKCQDWIQDVFYDSKQQYLILATAHNTIHVWNIKLKSYIKSYSCEEKCILYSCKFLGTGTEDFVLLCGTVFSEVLIWAPSPLPLKDHPLLHRLHGHSGVIFSIEVDPSEKLICTTSDDRSVRLWSVNVEGSILNRKAWEEAKISLTHTLYSHTARVWKSLILPNFIISAGEDSKLCVWNKTGILTNSIDLHQECGIRGLAYCPNKKSVITGGEDGGIKMLLPDRLKCNVQSFCCVSLDEKKFGIPRKVLIFDEIICTTDRGFLMAAENHALTKKIYENEEFRTYCLLEISPCNGYLMLGSIKGRVVVIEVKSKIVCFDEVVITDRIFALHWIGDHVVLCGPDGVLTIYRINLLSDNKLEKVKVLSLPKSKERWSTCALIHRGYLLLGDRIGRLHAYSMTSSEDNPRQTFVKVHGHLGVTDIVEYGDVILTAGRDGTVKQFSLVEGSFVCSLKYKLPMDWPWKIVKYKNDLIILGFSSVYFVLWNLQKREIIFKYDCGGGHRSCDFSIADDYLKFFYISNRQVRFVECSLSSSIQIRNGFHGKEINCFKILDSNPVVAVSGDEDTTLRISRITENSLEELYILDNHISSVRDVSMTSISTTEKLLISAGGRAQLSVHKFDYQTLKYQELENLFLTSLNKKMNMPSSEGETRIMCLDSMTLQNNTLICAACSDRKIRIFSYENHLTELLSIPYSHCILKVCFMEFYSHLLLLSTGTDGYAVFWNITHTKPTSFHKIDSIQIHQSGINSLEMKRLENGKFLLATGGDDNLLSILLLQLSVDEKVDILHKWESSNAHSCQITGIKFIKNLLLTTSIDQRLTIWQYNVEENVVSVKMIKQYFSIVADIQGIEVSQNKSTSVLVCMFGKGLEIIEIDISKIPD